MVGDDKMSFVNHIMPGDMKQPELNRTMPENSMNYEALKYKELTIDLFSQDSITRAIDADTMLKKRETQPAPP